MRGRSCLVLMLVAAVLGLARSGAAAAQEAASENIAAAGGGWTLAPGPKVEGVVLLQGGLWKPDVIRAFHETPWLDAASVRMEWRDLEPRDQEFNWSAPDRILEEVRRFNAAHPAAPRVMHVRVMGGVWCPKWFEAAGVRYYDTTHPTGKTATSPLHIPMPYDNPEYLKQLRQVYRAMAERYGGEPLVAVYHGTWSAGPWDEIFHPQGSAPLPPGYTPEKFVRGMVEQLDVLIDEFCLKGKVAELPYSGKYPPKERIDLTGALTARIVGRLGKRSPYIYIQSNGWGLMDRGVQTVSWGHERDIRDAFGQVNLALQALGTNAGGGWLPQGDWVGLAEIAEKFDASYLEIYPPDLLPIDAAHHIVEAFTHGGPGAAPAAGLPAGFRGFRPWLAKRGRVLYVREGVLRQAFASGKGSARLADMAVRAETPAETRIACRARTRTAGGAWSEWQDAARAADLPAGDEVLVEVQLHTDDGLATPRVLEVRPAWK
jgi:hypothetical protein